MTYSIHDERLNIEEILTEKDKWILKPEDSYGSQGLWPPLGRHRCFPPGSSFRQRGWGYAVNRYRPAAAVAAVHDKNIYSIAQTKSDTRFLFCLISHFAAVGSGQRLETTLCCISCAIGDKNEHDMLRFFICLAV